MRERKLDLQLKLDFRYGTDHIYCDLQETKTSTDYISTDSELGKRQDRIEESPKPGLSLSCRRTFSLTLSGHFEGKFRRHFSKAFFEGKASV
jgi:hypothetical protein